MQTMSRVVRAFFSSLWGWGSLMSGALMVGPSIYNAYRLANGQPPLSARSYWATYQLVGAVAFLVVMLRLWYVQYQRAEAADHRATSAEARLADVGAATRTRNNILAGLSDFVNRGNALRESVPRAGDASVEALLAQVQANTIGPVIAWQEDLEVWTEDTRAYLLKHSKSASARFDLMVGISDKLLPRVHHFVHADFLVLERRLENLRDITDNADSYLT